MTIYDLIWNAGSAVYQFGYHIGNTLAYFLF